jgi:hypothetical protein
MALKSVVLVGLDIKIYFKDARIQETSYKQDTITKLKDTNV